MILRSSKVIPMFKGTAQLQNRSVHSSVATHDRDRKNIMAKVSLHSSPRFCFLCSNLYTRSCSFFLLQSNTYFSDLIEAVTILDSIFKESAVALCGRIIVTLYDSCGVKYIPAAMEQTGQINSASDQLEESII